MRVLVVDDHPLMADALCTSMQAINPDVEARVVDTIQGAMMALAEAFSPSLILLDLSLPDSDRSCGPLISLREEYPAIPVVVVSGESDKSKILECLDAGAMGFIPKTSGRDVLLQAIRLVLHGGIYVPKEAITSGTLPSSHATQQSKAAGQSAIGKLSARQTEVLRLLIRGLPNKLIARELDIAENTVKIHVSAVLREMGVSNRTQALLVAHQAGFMAG
jgi:DNA-binding NarL/FixJ family response regulator